MMLKKTENDERPLLLVTNDDGIHALGLNLLAQHLSELGRVIVAAPDQEQSAVGHGISLSRPLRVLEIEKDRFAISGTPADSVLLALFQLCPRAPDLVLSGINHGLNVGTDVFYSGTLAGAFEALIHGLPSLAVSQELPPPVAGDGHGTLTALLDRTARFAAAVARRVLEVKAPRPPLAISINAPGQPGERFSWTRLGRRAYREQVVERVDLRGVPYYWIGGPPIPGSSEPGTDGYAVEAGLISLTPLGLDLTAELPAAYRQWGLDGYESAEVLEHAARTARVQQVHD